jgi:hypothetical protein
MLKEPLTHIKVALPDLKVKPALGKPLSQPRTLMEGLTARQLLQQRWR